MAQIPISYNEYKTSTGALGDPNKRGSKIRKIDSAFQNYERNFGRASEDEKIHLTLDLFVSCKDWLRAKSTKSEVKSGFFKVPKMNDLLLRRRQKIKEVANACLDALKVLDPSLLTEVHFNRRKIRVLAEGTRRHQSKSLSSGYLNERKSWLGSHKTQAFAGSGVHPTVRSEPEYKKKNFDTLSVKDYERIAQKHKTGKVRYIRKEERLHYMAEVRDGGLFFYPDGTKLDCGAQFGPEPEDVFREFLDNQTCLWMYAMDSYGNLITKEEEYKSSLMKIGLQFFNHSSFNSGREVTCAGCILFQNGKLRWIDNNSGHYKPSPENLRTCLKILFGDEADLTAASVGTVAFDKRGHLAGFDVWRAGTYLSGAEEPDLGALR